MSHKVTEISEFNDEFEYKKLVTLIKRNFSVNQPTIIKGIV
jgi:hypothetical protein